MKNVVIDRKKQKSPAPSKDQNPLGGCVLPKMRVAMGAGFGGCHDEKTFPLRFYGQNLAFPQHNTSTVHRWDIYYILGHLFLSYTWSKSRSCNSPMYHLISIAVSSLLSLVSPSGMPKSKPWDLPKIGIHDVNDVWDLDFPMKPPKLNPSRGLVFFVWTKYGIDVSFSLVC